MNVDLPWPAFLPRDYVPGQKLRIEVYRRLARLRDSKKLDDFRQELRDRFGPLPEPVEWLLRTTEMRLLCVRWQIASIHRDGPDLVFTYRNAEQAKQLAAAEPRPGEGGGREVALPAAEVRGRRHAGGDVPVAAERVEPGSDGLAGSCYGHFAVGFYRFPIGIALFAAEFASFAPFSTRFGGC